MCLLLLPVYIYVKAEVLCSSCFATAAQHEKIQEKKGI